MDDEAVSNNSDEDLEDKPKWDTGVGMDREEEGEELPGELDQKGEGSHEGEGEEAGVQAVVADKGKELNEEIWGQEAYDSL